MIFGHRPFGALYGVTGLVSQMIHFIEDLPDEWKDGWVEMKDEYAKTRGDDTSEHLDYFRPSLLIFYDVGDRRLSANIVFQLTSRRRRLLRNSSMISWKTRLIHRSVRCFR